MLDRARVRCRVAVLLGRTRLESNLGAREGQSVVFPLTRRLARAPKAASPCDAGSARHRPGAGRPGAYFRIVRIRQSGPALSLLVRTSARGSDARFAVAKENSPADEVRRWIAGKATASGRRALP